MCRADFRIAAPGLAAFGLAALLAASAHARELSTHKETILEGHYIVSLHAPSALETSDVVEQLRSFRRTRQELRDAGASGLPLRRPGQVRREQIASEAFQTHLEAAELRVEKALAALSSLLGRPLEASARFTVTSIGFTTQLSLSEVSKLVLDPRVVAVDPVVLWPVNTDVSSTFLGAVDLWSGAATGVATKGAGMLLGFIDTGIQRDHQSFGAAAGVINPYGAGNFKGLCAATPSLCNDKLVGIWDYEGGDPADPFDDSGHGSHVASIAVGNELVAGNPLPSIGGIAPLASLISYDACTQDPKTFFTVCPSSSIMQSIDQAILDGVDVLNISIRGGVNPWAGPMAESTKLLNALDLGIVVVASAGNDGPTADSVTRLDPWVITVAASTHPRKPYTATLTPVDGVAPPPPMIVQTIGPALGSAMSPLEVFYDGGGCAPPMEVDYSGKIVLCDRVIPITHPTVKAANLAALGAGGMVELTWFLPFPGVIPYSHTSFPPAGSMGPTDGDLLRTWAEAGAGPGGPPKAYVAAASLQEDPTFADIIPFYSSRGPVSEFDLLKPDLAAPGALILGAEYDIVQAGDAPGTIHVQYQRGTSQATPQVAGAAALLLDLDPTLTPAQVKSILQTTAQHAGMRKCDVVDFPIPCADPPVPANIFDFGAGRLAIAAAAKAGLALNETKTNFENADPAGRGSNDPATLNLASMAKRDCPGGCAFRRTFDGIATATVSWTGAFVGLSGGPLPANMQTHIVPSSFDLASAEQQAVVVGFYATSPAVEGLWQQMHLELTPSDGAISTARLPIVIKPSSSSPTTDLAVETVGVTSFFSPGNPVEFSVTVTNLGSLPAVGATITAAVPPDSAGVSWTCVSAGESLCGLESGNGAINLEGALFPGETLTISFVVADTSVVMGESIDFAATVTSPPGLGDSVAGNDTSMATIGPALFADGFESGNTSAWN